MCVDTSCCSRMSYLSFICLSPIVLLSCACLPMSVGCWFDMHSDSVYTLLSSPHSHVQFCSLRIIIIALLASLIMMPYVSWSVLSAVLIVYSHDVCVILSFSLSLSLLSYSFSFRCPFFGYSSSPSSLFRITYVCYPCIYPPIMYSVPYTRAMYMYNTLALPLSYSSYSTLMPVCPSSSLLVCSPR